MGDGTPGSRSTSGNLGHPASPLRIYTRVGSAGEHAAGDRSPGVREPANSLLGSAFARPPDDGSSDHGSRPGSGHRRQGEPSAAAARTGRAAPRLTRHPGHYHPLPSHWRGHESSPSNVSSPVTPDSGGSEDGPMRALPLTSSAGSQATYTPEPFRPFHNSSDYNSARPRPSRGQSPAASPYMQVGMLGDAFGSVSSLEWANDRPSSMQSYRSTEQTGAAHPGEGLPPESPLESPSYTGRFPPALGALAARSSAQRNKLGVHTGPSRHHPSASTSSSHYSYSMNSPPIRGTGTAAQSFGSREQSSSLPTTAVTLPSPDTAGEPSAALQGEDIVRKYFGLQRQPGGESSSESTRQQATASPLSKSPTGSGAGDESTGSIIYRRAVSSGDLPTLEEMHNAMQASAGGGEFLSHDLVESPLEALVRQLTIELFQLYVSEDRNNSKSTARQRGQDDDKDIAETLSRVLDPLNTDDGYVQQFRLGPSLRSGSTTPAVTMDGYFVPQTAGGAAETGPGDVRPRPRPRHRLLERTWMEEALIKARRVSTVDENAEELILQGLDLDSPASSSPEIPSLQSMATSVVDSLKVAGSPTGGSDLAQFSPPAGAPPRVAKRGQALQQGISGEGRGVQPRQASRERARMRPNAGGLPSLSEEGDESLTDDGTAQTLASSRSHYRARDPAAPHRKLPSERTGKTAVAHLSISPARASLLRAVGRRQSVRLQPGKGQIVVAETPTGTRASAAAGNRGSIVAPVTLDPDVVARAKRTNSLPGMMQVPETKEVSYRDVQRKAARRVQIRKAAKSRGRVARRAERMVRGGTQPPGGRSDGGGHGTRKRHGHHKRAGSRADMEQQLVCVELPPPVPLRVRREQVRIVPEPLIIVRRPVLRPTEDEVSTAEQKIMRVQNQLLGAQAVLSRHNSVMRQAARRKASGTKASRHKADADAALAMHSPGKNTVRNQALDAMMLESALDDRIDDDEMRRRAAVKQRQQQQRGEGAGNKCEGRDGSDGASTRPWRNARRRSTLRKKDRAQQRQPSDHDVNKPADREATVKAAHCQQRGPPTRQLLLHGSAYRIYSGHRARPDTYLFLFTDILVVAVRSSLEPGAALEMAAPSSDPSAILASWRFRVQFVIPISSRTTALKTQREGASKRAGEDDDAEERRVESQEKHIRRACYMFEKNPNEAVNYLAGHNIIMFTADVVADFLHRCTALSRRQTGGFLGAGVMGENLRDGPSTADDIERDKDFYQQIWIAFIDRCNIVGVPLDEALRSIVFHFRLPSNRRSTGILLEIAALQWLAKNKEFGPVSGVFLPESPEITAKLAYTIMMLNLEVHNPASHGETQPDSVYQAFLQRFRVSVVDDPALASKRKGNVLRKRDQPRVVTLMEVPVDHLKAIYERIVANRLVTCSDTCGAAPEFDVDWVRDANDVGGVPLTDEQVDKEVEDIYSDPGFRDGILFNATSDRLPGKFNISPRAYVRVTVRIPEPDPKFAIFVRVLGSTHDASVSGSGSDPICILPSNRLSFATSNAATFVMRPQKVGNFKIHFVSEGSRARYYHPIPPRTVAVEGAFMRQFVQLNWRRGDSQGSHSRYLFGLDSQSTKARWMDSISSALESMASVSSREVLRGAEKAAQALAALTPAAAAAADAAGTMARAPADPIIAPQHLLGALSQS
ncbi:hypothetical protein GGF46_000527 [Coemansia sp. RSA 552]|nr:hypothetical protein GGF46_000527 [Coemansia sp. RSA 552]